MASSVVSFKNVIKFFFVFFSSVEFFKQGTVYGFRCRVSGFRNSVYDEGVNCRNLVRRVKTTQLSAVICYLKPDTRHLKPKIKSCFINYLSDTKLYIKTQPPGLNYFLDFRYLTTIMP